MPELYTFRGGSNGQLGHPGGPKRDTETPTKVDTATSLHSFACGHFHALAVSQEGSTYSWGRGQMGLLGHGTEDDSTTPRKVGGLGLGAVKAVACGWRHTVAVAGDDDEVYTWGRCVNGQLGHGDTAQRETPAKVEALDLLRQGIAPAGDAAAKNAAKKRPRTEQDDMRVPSQKPHDADFAAVPDS